jgi:peptide deformylase
MSSVSILFGHQNDMLYHRVPEFNFNEPHGVDSVKLAHTLITEMKNNGGIGLAANQLGINVRAFVMYSEPPMVCFNPKITMYGDEEIALDEACLSYPTLTVKVKRPRFIRARFQDPYGNIVTKKFDGMAARVFQHEMDHLDGITYYKRANTIHKERFEKKWKKVLRTLKTRAK